MFVDNKHIVFDESIRVKRERSAAQTKGRILHTRGKQEKNIPPPIMVVLIISRFCDIARHGFYARFTLLLLAGYVDSIICCR